MTTIRDTVRQAQDTLARIHKHEDPVYRFWIPPLGSDAHIAFPAYPPVTMPQSLGELCLEWEADNIRDFHLHGMTITYGDMDLIGFCHQQSNALRTALYHRHTA